MSALFECGFSVREPMWHGEGMVAEDYPESWDQARQWAGLMWEPEQIPVFTKKLLTAKQITAMRAEGFKFIGAPESFDDPRDDRKWSVGVQVEDFQAIARDDTHDVLAVPTTSYETISHKAMGEIIEAVLDADGNVKFETAGSVRDGRQVWALAYLDEPYEVPGDTTQVFPFLALLNAHDGSAACKLTYTDVRVVCWNTWNAAASQGERSGAQFVFRHTGNVNERIEEAKTALAGLREESKGIKSMFEALAQTPVSDEQVKTFTQLFLPSPRDRGEFCSDRVHENVEKARNTFARLHDESVTTEGIRGSAYGLLQASTEYLDHVRGFRSRDTLMNRTLLRPEPMKAAALDLIDDVVGADWRDRVAGSKPVRARAKLVRKAS